MDAGQGHSEALIVPCSYVSAYVSKAARPGRHAKSNWCSSSCQVPFGSLVLSPCKASFVYPVRIMHKGWFFHTGACEHSYSRAESRPNLGFLTCQLQAQ